MKKTYAQRAASIKKRYKYADRVSADKQAMESEMLALFQEQEAYKKENGIAGPQNDQFATGGPGRGFRDMLGEIPGAFLDDIPTFEELQEKNKYTNDDIKRWTPTGDTLQFGEDFGDPGSIVDVDPTPPAEKEKFTMGPKELNIASGLSSALGNTLNMLNVQTPKRIDPTQVNPTFNFNETDLTPYMTALDNELASTRYGFLEAGADFDTASAGIIRANQKFAQSRGQMTLEQSMLNQKEAARGDEIFNKAAYFNAAQNTQADIDKAARNDVAQQRRRDYLAAISTDISSIFEDEGNRKMAEYLAPILGNIGGLEGIIASGNKAGV